MNDNKSRLKLLPTEILIIIFQHINARDLYRSFYDLTYRFKSILQSLEHLYIHFYDGVIMKDRHRRLFASRVETIIIEKNRSIHNLEPFINVRSLIFRKSSPERIEHIINQLPNVEYIAITINSAPNLSDIYRSIFSNKFPKLKSCTLNNFQPKLFINQWKKSPSIHFLHIISTIPSIQAPLLSACPNLHFLKLSIPELYGTPSHQRLNKKLERLILNFTSIGWPIDDVIFDSLFACIPNLERLCIYRLVPNAKMMNTLIEYDWLAAVLTRRLPLLCRFKFILHLCNSEDSNTIDFDRLKRNFMKFHEHRYECRLEIV